MPTYNYKSRELIAKIVYYGPGRCGKTTNLQQIHARMRPETRSELLSVATETDRTIYFDLLPLNLGTISGMKFMVRLFTVPGQVYYSETRKLVLKGADGIVFVADSQDHMADENRQSLQDLKQNLAANGIDYDTVPLVMQWNKRDLPQLIPEAELGAMLNERKVKTVSSIASKGDGVLETLRHVTLGVFNHIKSGGKVGAGAAPSARPTPAPRVPSAAKPAAQGNVQPGTWSASIPKTSVADKSAAAAAPVAASSPAPVAKPKPAKRPAKLPEDGPQPMKIGTDMIMDEFRNLAVMHSQLTERVSHLESELARQGQDFQEMREILARQSRA